MLISPVCVHHGEYVHNLDGIGWTFVVIKKFGKMRYIRLLSVRHSVLFHNELLKTKTMH